MIEKYTEAQATDEAVLMLMRKLHRLHPKAHLDLMARLNEGAREALAHAERRADDLRIADQRATVSRTWPTRFEDDEDEEVIHDCGLAGGPCYC